VADLVLNHQEQSWILFEGENLVGRSLANAVSIDLKGVSRRHCKVTISGEQITLEDLGSRFGTFVNGKLVKEATLQPGDNFRIGDAQLVLSMTDQPPGEAPQPAAAATEVQAEDTPAGEEDPGLTSEPEAAGQDDVVFCPECGLPNVPSDAQCFNCDTELPGDESTPQ